MKRKKTIKITLTVLILNFLIIANTVCAAAVPIDLIPIQGETYSEELQENEVDPADEGLLYNPHTPTLEDEFAEDKIRVIIKHRYSVVNADITLENLNDFIKMPEDGSVDRELLNFTAVEDKSLRKLENDSGLINFEKFHQSLVVTLKNSNKQKVLAAADELLKCEGVIATEPDYIYTLSAQFIPNDTKYSGGVNSQWHPYKIGLEKAWDSATGNSVRVGIVEKGYTQHEDLSNNFVKKISGDSETEANHGTNVAGALCADGNNAKGICGTAYKSKLYVFTNDITAAVQYANNNDIKIINVSHITLSNGKLAPYQIDHKQIIESYNGLLIASAGNYSNNTDSTPVYPASYSTVLNNVISVGSTDKNDNISGFSNYGKTSVNLFAPGERIYTTTGSNGYEFQSGTSFSAPLVAGVAALLLEKNKDLKPTALKYAIMSGVDKIDGLANLCVSGGRLNAAKALETIAISKYSSNLPAIVVKEVYFRTWHGTDKGTAIRKLPVGTKLTILGYYKNSPNWLYAKTESGEKGYVSKLYLQTENYKKYSKPIPAVMKNAMSLRYIPSTDSKIMQNTIPVNTTVTMLGYCETSPNWVFAELDNGKRGYISKLNANVYDYTAHSKSIPAVCSGAVALRGGPSTDSPKIISSMPAGTSLEIKGYYASSVNWVCVKTRDGKIGYASKLYMDLYEYTSYSVGKPAVIKEALSLRTAPYIGAEINVVTVPVKTRLTINGYYPSSPAWLYVTLSSGQKGYLSKHNLNIYEYTKYSSSLQGEITAPVAIRDGHSTDANVVLANVAVGNKFTAIGYCPTSPNWLYIKLSNGATGFISRLNTNIPANS